MPETKTISEELRKFIIENFLFGREGIRLADEDSFLDKGIIDSTGMLELVAFLQEEYGIKVSDEDFIPENLDSIQNLLKFLKAKQAAAQHG